MKRLLIAILLFSSCVLHARSYLDAGLRAGLSGLIYDCEYGGTSPGYHLAVDLGYLYKSPYWIAFRVGASIETASSSYRKTDYEDQYTTIDVDNEKMRVQYTIGMLRERHQTYSVSFPLQVGFNIQQFIFLIGPRFVLPLSGSWKETISDASLSVYFPKYDNLVEESYPLAASRNFEMEASGKLTLQNWQCALAGELTYDILHGSSYRRAESFLSVGVYFDVCLMPTTTCPVEERYGILHLTDMKDGLPLSRISTPVLQAWHSERPLVAKFNSFDVGIKVAYRLTSAPRMQKRRHGCNCYE